MQHDIHIPAYTKKKATNATKTSHCSIGKKDHPAYQLSNNLSGLNESLGFSTIKGNESMDVKQLTLKDRDTDDRGKTKANEEYNMLFWNNYEGMQKPALIGRKVTMKGNQVSSSVGNDVENTKLGSLPKENESNLLFPFNSFNDQGQGNDPRQEDMLNYYLNYNKNKDKDKEDSNRNSSHHSKRECFVNNNKSNSNSNTFSFKNFLSHQLRPLPEDSKDNNNDNCNNSNIHIPSNKYCKRDNYGTKLRDIVVNEIVEEDDLTPLPVRKEKIHPIAEYEFNQARSAAVLIRRIEYSYHLKSIRQYKKFERQIIYIQRWWKTVLENRNANILRDLIEYELRNSNYFPQEDCSRNYIDLALTIERVTDINRIKKAFECLYDNFADLSWYNQTCESVDMIIRAYRKHKEKIKGKGLRRFKYFLYFLYRKLYVRKIILGKREFEKDIDKITKIQAAIAGYLFRKCDKVVIEIGRNYHPFLYYRIKYNNDDTQCKAKMAKFIRMVNKWKQYVKERKLKRAALLGDQLNKFFFRYYFDFLLTQIIKKTNAIITIILLKPHREFLLSVLYQSRLQKYFIKWKKEYLDKKRRCILIKNIINKILAIKVFKPLVKKYKRKSRLISLIKTITYLFNAKMSRNKMIKFKTFQLYYYKLLSKSKHQVLLWKLMSNKTKKNLRHYFTFLRIMSMNNAKNIFMIKYGLNEVTKVIRNMVMSTYKKEKESLRFNKNIGVPSFLSLIHYFSYSKSLFWLKRLLLNLPIKFSLSSAIAKWKKKIVSLSKVKDNKLRNVALIYNRQTKRYMNRYLFRYIKNSPIHPNMISSKINKGMQIINNIFNKKYTYDLYNRLQRGSYRKCLSLLIKVIIEMSKAKVSLHKASFIKMLQMNKQYQNTKQLKSYQIVSIRTKDEFKLLLKYYYKWIRIAIKDYYIKHEDEMNLRQLEKFKQICIKRIILHQGSLLLRNGIFKWRNIAETKTHQLTMKTAIKKRDMKIIVSNKKNEDDKALRRFWFKWRQVCFSYIKKEFNVINGISKLISLKKKEVFEVIIKSLSDKYNEDKDYLIKKVVLIKISKEDNRLRVMVTKWRYINQYDSLITSTSLIQERLRKKNRNMKGLCLSKVMKTLFNKRTFNTIIVFIFNTLISKVTMKKETRVLKKRFTHWVLHSIMVQYNISTSNTTTINNKVSDSLLRRYVIEIENQSEHVYQFKTLEYQIQVETIRHREIKQSNELIDITHLLKHLIQFKQYHQMRITTSKKKSLFMYWRHLQSLLAIKRKVINFISSRIDNETAIERIAIRKWNKTSKMISLISAVKCIQRKYAKYKLIECSKTEFQSEQS